MKKWKVVLFQKYSFLHQLPTQNIMFNLYDFSTLFCLGNQNLESGCTFFLSFYLFHKEYVAKIGEQFYRNSFFSPYSLILTIFKFLDLRIHNLGSINKIWKKMADCSQLIISLTLTKGRKVQRKYEEPNHIFVPSLIGPCRVLSENAKNNECWNGTWFHWCSIFQQCNFDVQNVLNFENWFGKMPKPIQSHWRISNLQRSRAGLFAKAQ